MLLFCDAFEVLLVLYFLSYQILQRALDWLLTMSVCHFYMIFWHVTRPFRDTNSNIFIVFHWDLAFTLPLQVIKKKFTSGSFMISPSFWISSISWWIAHLLVMPRLVSPMLGAMLGLATFGAVSRLWLSPWKGNNKIMKQSVNGKRTFQLLYPNKIITEKKQKGERYKSNE